MPYHLVFPRALNKQVDDLFRRCHTRDFMPSLRPNKGPLVTKPGSAKRRLCRVEPGRVLFAPTSEAVGASREVVALDVLTLVREWLQVTAKAHRAPCVLGQSPQHIRRSLVATVAILEGTGVEVCISVTALRRPA